MTINTKIIERLREYGISKDDGINYLLGYYYGHVSQYYPEIFIKKMVVTKIYEGDQKTRTVKWNIPLFDEQVTGFEWVEAWMEEFGDINKDRKGVKTYVMSRMKKFFVEHPEIRKDDVFSATRMYFRNVDNPKYLKSSHKFIMEGKGADKYSLLLEWVEKYKHWEGLDANRTTTRNTMQ